LAKAKDRVDEMMARKVNFRRLGTPGECLDLHETLALDLAREYQKQEEHDYVCISWKNQERAQEHFNAYGFAATLDHMLSLRAKNNGAR
jgi:hypothetical protein